MKDETLPELLAIQAQEVVKRAKALGLTWTLRPATVDASGSDSILVRYDGDSEQIGAVSLTGTVFPDDHVMMLQVPPAGNFILGRLNSSVAGPKATPTFRGKNISLGDVTLTTAIQAVSPLTSLDVDTPGEFLITGIIDLDQTVSGGNNLAIGRLEIDGVAQTEQVLFAVTAAGQRATVSQTWHGTLTAGTHTFGLTATKNLNIGTFIARATHTGFTYQIWQ